MQSTGKCGAAEQSSSTRYQLCADHTDLTVTDTATVSITTTNPSWRTAYVNEPIDATKKTTISFVINKGSPSINGFMRQVMFGIAPKEVATSSGFVGAYTRGYSFYAQDGTKWNRGKSAGLQAPAVAPGEEVSVISNGKAMFVSVAGDKPRKLFGLPRKVPLYATVSLSGEAGVSVSLTQVVEEEETKEP